jgi:hypothetical protein
MLNEWVCVDGYANEHGLKDTGQNDPIMKAHESQCPVIVVPTRGRQAGYKGCPTLLKRGNRPKPPGLPSPLSKVAFPVEAGNHPH